MRSIAMLGALAVFAATPLAAQGNFRTGGIDPNRRTPTTTGGSVLGDILGTHRDTLQRRRNSDHIPPGKLPPAGMCRIWIDGVPPGHQPAPTDCQTAVATKPANARVIWGDQNAFPGNGKGKVKQAKGNKGRGHGVDRDDDDVFDRNRAQTRDNGSLIRGNGKHVAKKGKKG